VIVIVTSAEWPVAPVTEAAAEMEYCPGGVAASVFSPPDDLTPPHDVIPMAVNDPSSRTSQRQIYP
jgi:hypothetical protein